MKYIKKIENKSNSKKQSLVLFFLILVVSFWFSLNFVGKSKKDVPDLLFDKVLDAPTSSSDGGFFEAPISVSLFSNNPKTKIYYTLDGSEPTLKSAIYDGSIQIADISSSRNHLSAIPTSPRWKPPIGNVSKGTILRAIIVDENNNKSAELKRSFFILKNKKRYSLPVISIIINQKDFFGYNKGIYVLGKTYTDKDNYIRKKVPLDLPWWDYPANYMLRGSDQERDAFIQFYEPSGKLGFQSDAGIRINGNATRAFPQKSLRICYRAKYGQPELIYDLFPSNRVKKFNSFVLRNSGNDWNKTMFRDALMQSLLKDMAVDIQDYRPAILFINGEYWGIHNIRERFDQSYLATKYDINKDSVTILELNGNLVYGEKNEEESFFDLVDFVKKNDLSVENNYDKVKSQMDIQSFLDFMITNLYFCNSDWPNNNVKFWKYHGTYASDSLKVKDGRWRWIVFDTDWGFGYNSQSMPSSNLLNRATKIGNVGVLFAGLLKNEEFKQQFLDRFQLLLNTTFESENVVSKISSFESTLSPEIEEHINRWRSIENKRNWTIEVEVMKDFARSRPHYQAEQLNTFFNLQGDKQITVKNSSKDH